MRTSASTANLILSSLALLAAALPTSAQVGAGSGSAPTAPAASAVVPAAEQFVRAGSQGARLYNLKDPQAALLAQLPAGALLRVQQKHAAGWLEVETPGGLAVWIYGKYLSLSEDGRWAEVTADRVNLRPRPSTDKSSFPLAMQVHRGARLRVLERAQLSPDLAQDWLRVWSPEGATAYVQASSTSALESGLNGAELWRSALAASDRPAPPAWTRPEPGATTDRDEPPKAVASENAAPAGAASVAGSTAGAVPSAEPAEAEAPAVAGSLQAARQLFAAERVKREPDFAAVRAAFAAVVSSGSAEDARAAREDLVQVEGASLKRDLEREAERRQLALQEEQRKLREAAASKDPLQGRFEGRGRLVRRESSGSLRWYLQFSGKDSYELSCSSGRYRLELFAGYELGVNGSSQNNERGQKCIDVTRIEVLSQR